LATGGQSAALSRFRSRSNAPFFDQRSKIRNPVSALRPIAKLQELSRKIGFCFAEWLLEEARKMAQNANLTAPVRKFDEADEIQHQRRSQQRITALPGEL
jgi:hypothetical protein